MGSFLPLIEAFAAFALTMVALTTAVGTILGIVQRGLRLRAHGLRELMTYFFRNEVKPRLADLSKIQPPLPWGDDLEKALPQFLVDMTFLPTVHPVVRDAPDPRVSSAQMGQSTSPLIRWKSLNYGVDSLNDDEFATRLKASDIHDVIAARLPPEKLTLALTEMSARFQAYARAATESFARTARIGTVILGLLLAFGLNIDAFALLGRYMTDPKLTSEIIARQTETLKAQSNVPGQTTTAALGITPINPDVQKLQQKLELLTKAIGDAGSAASTIEIAAVRDATKETQEALKPVQADLNAATEAMGVLGTNTAAVRGELADLSRAFPIGWALYPGCTGPTLDSRCLTVQYSAEIPMRFWGRLAWIAGNDTGNFIRWLGGTMILGLLLGLGTPFWVEVSNNFLRARQLIADPVPTTPNNLTASPPSGTAAQAAPAPATSNPTTPNQRLG